MFDKVFPDDNSRYVISDASEKEALLEDRSVAENGLFYQNPKKAKKKMNLKC